MPRAVVVLTTASLIGLFAATTLRAQSELVEETLSIPKRGLFTVNLEATVFKADGPGPFPLAVINHGKALGNPTLQARYRPASAVRYFLQRGYVVVAPMRQGFANSGGLYIDSGCNIESNGRTQADDVLATLAFMSEQPYVDKQRIIVLGQSHGGWVTLALGASNPPVGVKGLVNFAGGLRQESCPGWKSSIARAAGGLGRDSRLPSLWFYGDNDSYFQPFVWQGMHKAYVEAGGNARLVAFGQFGGDAHAMFGRREGEPIWQPELDRFLRELGLPSEISQPRFARKQALVAPAKTDFAAIGDAAMVPFVNDKGREAYLRFASNLAPCAFAISPSGSFGWSQGGDDSLARALNFCNQRGVGTCKLYAVDNDVVWQP